MKCSLGISNFLEEISSLSHSIVFLYFLQWSLRKAFLSLLALLWNSAFKWVYLSLSPLPSLLFTAICKVSSDNLFAFLFLGDGLGHCLLYNVTNLCPYSPGTLSDLIPCIYLSLPLYNCKGFDISHSSMVSLNMCYILPVPCIFRFWTMFLSTSIALLGCVQFSFSLYTFTSCGLNLYT